MPRPLPLTTAYVRAYKARLATGQPDPRPRIFVEVEGAPGNPHTVSLATAADILAKPPGQPFRVRMTPNSLNVILWTTKRPV